MNDLSLALRSLVQWSKQHFHFLPWRQLPASQQVYGRVVSETMLQQTTVSTVQVRFVAFLKRFPDWQALTQATPEQLLDAWQGLGYYQRVKRLQQLAVTLAGQPLPDQEAALLKLPGIGPYMARALLALVYNQPCLGVDANLQRLAMRLRPEQSTEKTLEWLLKTYQQSTTRAGVSIGDFQEALMDLGRTYCQAKSKQCHICPLVHHCKSAHVPLERDLWNLQQAEKKIAKAPLLHYQLVRIIVRQRGGKLLLTQRQTGQWLEGQWELPSILLATSTQEVKQQNKIAHQYPVITEQQWKRVKKNWKIADVPVKNFNSTITKYKFMNIVVGSEQSWTKLQQDVHWKSYWGSNAVFSWLSQDQLANCTSATRKAFI